jgi:hypothetical protein
MKIKSHTVFMIALTLALGWNAFPTQAAKASGGLRLSRPVEMPEAVHFSWTGGAEGTTYSIYRRPYGTTQWERIQMGLQGVSGSVTVPGFTLNMTWQYEMRADIP